MVILRRVSVDSHLGCSQGQPLVCSSRGRGAPNELVLIGDSGPDRRDYPSCRALDLAGSYLIDDRPV